MRALARDFITNTTDRRSFLKQMTACGYTLAAAESVAAVLAPFSSASAQTADRNFRVVEGTGSFLLVQQLKAAGVKHVFYGNGTASASMLDAMAGDNDIHLILAPSENIVTAMASGYALASNNPTFVNVHGTVGTAQQMLQMFNAKKDNVPLVVSSYTKSQESAGRDGFEAVDDLVEITKQFSRWSFEIPLAHRVPEILRNAIRISTVPPGGPTYLSIPQDVGQAKGKAEIVPKQYFTVPVRPKPDVQLIERAAQMLLEAKKPFMVVGHEVWRCDAYDEVVRLAELVGMPVVQGLSPYTDFPTDHALYIGQNDRSLGGFRSLRGVDLVFNLGSQMLYREGAQQIVSSEWKVIEARVTPDDLARHNHVDVAIVGDIRETARSLIEAITRSQTSAHRDSAKNRIDEAAVFSRRVAEARNKMLADRLDSVPVVWERVAQEANLVLEKDAIITHEMNSALPRILPWFEFGKGKKELYGRTLGSGLGWSVGAAIGIKMAKPDRQVVCMLGDGAFLMGGQVEALWCARRFEVPVLYIVFNNRSFNDTRMRAVALAPKLRELNIDLGSYLGNPDVSFVQAAKAFDVDGVTVTKPGEIADALKRGVRELREGRPFIIDVIAERVGLLADSTWYPRYSVAEQRKNRV